MASKGVLNATVQKLEQQVKLLTEQAAHSDAIHVKKDAEILNLKQMLLNVEKQQLAGNAQQVEANLRGLMNPAENTRFNFNTGTFDPEPVASAPAKKRVKS